MTNELAEFGYLWDGSSASWALLHINIGKEEIPQYLIVNTEERNALLIRQDELYEKVKQKMLEEGVRIVSVGNGY